MWPPPSTNKDLDAGEAPYVRPLPRRSKPIATPSAASGHHPSSSSAVPFSWEHLPGIPKAPGPVAAHPTDPFLLPLPPPLRPASHAGSRKKRPAVDPFAAALAACTKGPPAPAIEELFARSGSAAGRRRESAAAAWSISHRLRLFGLHSSCTATCAVADSTVYVPRSGSSYGPLSRRSA